MYSRFDLDFRFLPGRRDVALTAFVAAGIGLLVACNPDYELGVGPDDPDGYGEDDGGGVTGRVCAPSQEAWVSGADVWVDHEFGTARTTTDAEGWFTLTGVPPGPQVVNIEKGSFSSTIEVEITYGEILELQEEACIQDDEVSIAVVTGMFDSIGHVLDRLGIEYTLIDGEYDSTATQALLGDPAALEQYDIIFFNCGMDDGWIGGQHTYAANLRDYVSNGGSVYASDWAYYMVEAAFPDMVDFVGDDSFSGDAYVGDEGMIHATVSDAAIASALGSTQAQINYDLPMWAAVESVGDPSYSMLSGTFTYEYTNTLTAPLAAKMSFGDGTVLYTSFHNEAQSTADMDVILQEIIFHL